MTKWRVHYLFLQAWVVFEMHWENKHHTEAQFEESCEELGRRLGLHYAYREEIPCES